MNPNIRGGGVQFRNSGMKGLPLRRTEGVFREDENNKGPNQPARPHSIIMSFNVCCFYNIQ